LETGRPVERGGKVFPGPAMFGGAPSFKNSEKGVPDSFFLAASNMHKFHSAAAPDPAGGAYDAPRTPNRVVRGHAVIPRSSESSHSIESTARLERHASAIMRYIPYFV